MALLVQLVLTFPEGRPWSRAARARDRRRLPATLGGQLVGAFVFPTRATCSRCVAPDRGRRRRPGAGILGCRRRARRARPRRCGACSFCADRRTARAGAAAGRRGAHCPRRSCSCCVGRAVELAGRRYASRRSAAPSRCSSRSGSSPGSSGRGCAGRRRPTSSSSCEPRGRPACASASRGSSATRHSTLPIASTTAATSTPRARPLELPQGPDRAVTLVTARGEEVAALVHDRRCSTSRRSSSPSARRPGSCSRTSVWRPRCARSSPRCGHRAPGSSPRPTPSGGGSSATSTTGPSSGSSRSRSRSDSRPPRRRGGRPTCWLRAQDEVEEAIAELRELARGIHPTLLREEGLEAAVDALARRTPLPVAVEGSVGERLPDAVELAAYFLVSEA